MPITKEAVLRVVRAEVTAPAALRTRLLLGSGAALRVTLNGKMVYEKFSGRPCKLGLQKEPLYGAHVFVLPSTSGANAGTDRGVKTRYFKKLAALLKSLKD